MLRQCGRSKAVQIDHVNTLGTKRLTLKHNELHSNLLQIQLTPLPQGGGPERRRHAARLHVQSRREAVLSRLKPVFASTVQYVLCVGSLTQRPYVRERERERERVASACMRRHQASALAPVPVCDSP